MAQRLLLLGVVGSGLALNAFGISHFNTSEMSSMFDTGTGNAGRDSSAEADTGGRPGFNVKAMVKHFLKAGNRRLVPMEVQMNHRLHHILRRIMNDDPEIEKLEAEIKDLEGEKEFLELEAEAAGNAATVEDLEGKKEFLEDEAVVADDAATKEDLQNQIEKLEAEIKGLKLFKTQIAEIDTKIEVLRDLKHKQTAKISKGKHDGTNKTKQEHNRDKVKRDLKGLYLKKKQLVKKVDNEVSKITKSAGPKKVDTSLNKASPVTQDKKPAECKQPAAAPGTLTDAGKQFENRFDVIDESEEKSLDRGLLLDWLDSNKVKTVVNNWCRVNGQKKRTSDGEVIRQNGVELVKYWQCRICKGLLRPDCKYKFQYTFSDCKILLKDKV